ncbi:hypothetical protein CCACVL1_30748 [Corchorus capsularis]|uniref:Uncharacterized protein n=1 Tax=Corchorus capsularis TaxID=210143 RepID=A0A1R3FVZ1_COCAP|nr:hypothetical protein CCACVL1_30748 [Corchorus capsularis]
MARSELEYPTLFQHPMDSAFSSRT